jgi:molybdate transport system substrate-binding protein
MNLMKPAIKRAAQINYYWLLFLASGAVLAGLLLLLMRDEIHWPGSAKKEPLIVYCAAGVKTPVEQTAREYEKEFGILVQLQYDNSQTLLVGIEVSQRGDLYVPADDRYIDLAREKNLVEESLDLANMSAVLAVKKGNPLGVQSIDDLIHKHAKLAHANPDAAAVGKLSRESLRKSGSWEKYAKQVIVYKGTVSDVANDIRLGTVDGGIIWDAMLHQFADLEAVPLPELADASAHLQVAVLRCSTQPAEALRFARYLAAPEHGLKQFQQYGYRLQAPSR